MTAAQLKAWRLQHKLSQAAAAAKLGCSRRSIQQWESGDNEIPKYIAMALSAVLFNLPAYGDAPKPGRKN